MSNGHLATKADVDGVRNEVQALQGQMRQALQGQMRQALPAWSYTGRVPIAKLTGGGVDGYLQFQQGVLIMVQAPT